MFHREEIARSAGDRWKGKTDNQERNMGTKLRAPLEIGRKRASGREGGKIAGFVCARETGERLPRSFLSANRNSFSFLPSSLPSSSQFSDVDQSYRAR